MPRPRESKKNKKLSKYSKKCSKLLLRLHRHNQFKLSKILRNNKNPNSSKFPFLKNLLFKYPPKSNLKLCKL
jgi:hypothetical protein